MSDPNFVPPQISTSRKANSADQAPDQRSKADQHGDRLKSIGLLLIALVCFSLLDTIAKYVTTMSNVPIEQTIWLRFLGQFVFVMALVPAFGIMSLGALFQTVQLRAQIVRSVLMAVTTAFNFLALKYLRLDQTITIFFLSSLLVPLVAGPVLGEWIGWRRLVAIIIGFVGILVVVRPGFGDVHPAVIYSFAAVAAYVAFILLTRQIAGNDPPFVTLHYSLIVGTLVGAPIALSVWQPPGDMFTWFLLGMMGVFGGVGHYLLIVAHRLAPASILAPFIYFQIITMVILGYLVFEDLPDVWTAIGASIVVSSGLYLIHRERVTKE
ncbi:MAG: DMT family transporter [Hyphomicrobiaceae bacterium]